MKKIILFGLIIVGNATTLASADTFSKKMTEEELERYINFFWAKEEEGDAAILLVVGLSDHWQQADALKLVRVLLTKGANPNRMGNHYEVNMTPLFLAVIEYDIPMVELLLQYNADVNQGSEKGITPLQFINKQKLFDSEQLVKKNAIKNILQKKLNELKEVSKAWQVCVEKIIHEQKTGAVFPIIDRIKATLNGDCEYKDNEE